MKKDLKFNVFYGTEDFTKIFDSFIEDKMKSIKENIINKRYNKSDKCYSSTAKEVDVNE